MLSMTQSPAIEKPNLVPPQPDLAISSKGSAEPADANSSYDIWTLCQRDPPLAGPRFARDRGFVYNGWPIKATDPSKE